MSLIAPIQKMSPLEWSIWTSLPLMCLWTPFFSNQPGHLLMRLPFSKYPWLPQLGAFFNGRLIGIYFCPSPIPTWALYPQVPSQCVSEYLTLSSGPLLPPPFANDSLCLRLEISHKFPHFSIFNFSHYWTLSLKTQHHSWVMAALSCSSLFSLPFRIAFRT